MNKVVVIGGGASGIVASIVAARNGEHVTLLEGNDKCGKKILLTGNGKCNYWNSDLSINNYFTDDFNMLKEIMCVDNQNKVFSFLSDIGIYPRIKNGYYYPYSNQASSVRELLLKELEKSGVNIILSCKVENVYKEKDKFVVKSNLDTIYADKVIVATGSKACPKTGSDGSGYDIAKSFGHRINNVLPALVQLRANDSSLKDLDGIRMDAKIFLSVDDKEIAQEEGEILFTDYGLSGICVFNLSGLVSKYLYYDKKVDIYLNLCPFLEESFYTWFTKRNDEIPNHTIEELLESIFSYKLILVLLKKMKLDRGVTWDNLKEVEKQEFSSMIENYKLEINGTNLFDRAQVCTGGVPLNEVSSVMESKKEKGLYLVGELLDVDGKCGGFNLAFAWISGYLAGRGSFDD